MEAAASFLRSLSRYYLAFHWHLPTGQLALFGTELVVFPLLQASLIITKLYTT